MKIFLFLLCSTLLLGCADSGSTSNSYLGSSEGYEIVELTSYEKGSLLSDALYAISMKTPYLWGGDSLEHGMDCSGLIQWAYRQQGIDVFIEGDSLWNDATADTLYRYNSVLVDGIEGIERGDFIFFDQNGDGVIDHNSIYDRTDENGDIWVYDAYSVEGLVMHRIVNDFWEKNPSFALASRAAKLN